MLEDQNQNGFRSVLYGYQEKKMSIGRAEIQPERLSAYQATARLRQHQQLRQLELQHQRGWTLARQGAQMLKKKFGAQRVVLFGSLLDLKRMHQRSDIDLAVWGLDERHYLRAVAKLLDLDPDFSFDLVEAEYARPKILAAIETSGVEL